MLTGAINNGTIIDTKNQKRMKKNIGICGSKIITLSEEPLQGSQYTLDASGLTISPGFIDVHGHIDGYLYSGELSAFQGITTSIGGNCGLSPLQMDHFFQKQSISGFPINQGELIGHSFTLRKAVGLTNPHTKASDFQLKKMYALAETALKEGALGISFGLDYSPGASLQELLHLSALCKKYERPCSVHTRLFTEHDLNSLYELFMVSKLTGVTLLLSHFVYQYCATHLESAVKIVDDAVRSGLPIWMDSGMYTSWATYIGTATYEMQTLKDNEMSFRNMVVATGPYFGQTMTESIYQDMRQNYPDESVIYFEGCPNDVYICLQKPYCMPSTDIGCYKKGEGHPQIAGTFPKYIREMVHDQKLLSLEEAIYKATLLPAVLFGMKTKGILEPSMDADIIIFDEESIKDTAKFPGQGMPNAKPEGIYHVLVQGQPVIADQKLTGLCPGQIIRHDT